ASLHQHHTGEALRELELATALRGLDRILPLGLDAPHLLAGLQLDTHERGVLRTVTVDAVEIAVLAERSHKVGLERGVGPDLLCSAVGLYIQEQRALTIAFGDVDLVADDQ